LRAVCLVAGRVDEKVAEMAALRAVCLVAGRVDLTVDP